MDKLYDILLKCIIQSVIKINSKLNHNIFIRCIVILPILSFNRMIAQQ